jgi:ABC-type Fe3+ transport system substrate-binding protein
MMAIALMISAVACAPAPAPAPTAAPPTAAPAAPAAPTTASAPAATSAPAPTTAAAAPSAADLLAAAKKEGKVVIYTSFNAEEFDPVAATFNKKYPDIKVDYYRANSEDVAAKALNEFRANSFLVDILETNDTDIVNLWSAGILGPYKSAELKGYPDGSFDPDGFFATSRVNLVVITYNTNLVKKEDAPKKLEDLLDPKYANGKMAVEASDFPLMAYTQKVMGDAKSNEFWTKLGAQKPRVVVGHTELANFLAAGEFAISPTVYAHRVESLKDKKAPVEWVRTEPVYAFPLDLGIAKNAPHPNAAKVWTDWFFSAEGQQAVADIGRFPARPGIKTKPPGLLDGLKIYFGDPKTLLKADDIKKQYATIFGIK